MLIAKKPGVTTRRDSFAAGLLAAGGPVTYDPPASAVGAIRAEHMTVSGGFLTAISDQVGDGSWLTINGNVEATDTDGIDSGSFNTAGSISIDLSGFDGTQCIAMRVKENGDALTNGMMLCTSGGSFAGVFTSGNGTAHNQGITVDDIDVEGTSLGATPTRGDVWDEMTPNAGAPSSKNIAILAPTGTTLRPFWYNQAAWLGGYIIEGIVLFDDPSEVDDAYLWLSGPSAPVITGVPTIAGNAWVGATLTATAASTSGLPTPATTWQWYRDDVAISGATSATYKLVGADQGTIIHVVQTETNSEGSDTAQSADTATIGAMQIGDDQVAQMSLMTLVTAPDNTLDVAQMSVMSLVTAPDNTLNVAQMSLMVLVKEP